MTLEQWLEKENMTVYKLGKELGYARGYLYQVMGGKMPVSKEMARRIYNLTKGEVDLRF